MGPAGGGGGAPGERGSASPYVFTMPGPMGPAGEGFPATPPAGRSRFPDAPEGVGRGERLPLSPSEGAFFASGGASAAAAARAAAGWPALHRREGRRGGGAAIFSDFGGGLGGGSVVSETRKRDNLRIPRSLRRGGSSRQQPQPAPFPTPPRTSTWPTARPPRRLPWQRWRRPPRAPLAPPPMPPPTRRPL
eukprot:TRINITY_DN2216_c0_g1_i8.p3 TRINITY_DN2216_c0_g1~~TRINITY_DN2216_c0_g1_i8.p3  ORF type:complete len:191 (+),score=9.85 TRINITY_DN2216_c0_g1_i8:771-1343(+)